MTLNSRQIEAAKLLANGRTHQEVADFLGISRRTVLRWLKDSEFQEFHKELCDQQKTVSIEEFKQKKTTLSNSLKPSNTTPLKFDEQLDILGFEALDFLSELIRDPDARNCDKLKAVSLLIQVSSWDYRYSQQRELHRGLGF
jgi:transcriptional regulator with XRE-family HTH domain